MSSSRMCKVWSAELRLFFELFPRQKYLCEIIASVFGDSQTDAGFGPTIAKHVASVAGRIHPLLDGEFGRFVVTAKKCNVFADRPPHSQPDLIRSAIDHQTVGSAMTKESFIG